MREKLSMLAIIFLMLSGCSIQKEPPIVQPGGIEEPDNLVEEPAEPPTPHVFTASASNFHFIAGWLDDTQILYVEKHGAFYKVNYFDIATGESGLVYEEESFIIDVLIHPSRDYLLVHTSEDPASAIIKVVGMDGVVKHRVEIDSTELAIEWNRTNPEKILLTAFHEDWSFDLFVFDGFDDSLSIIELDDPFPKWAGENNIMSLLFEDHPLDGGEIQLFRLDTGAVEMTGIGNVIYFDQFNDSFFLDVQALDSEEFTYTIRTFDANVVSRWTLPAISNYSEWVVPTVEWIDSNRLIVKSAEKSGQLDEMASGFNLYMFEEGNSELLLRGLDAGPLNCSPSGRYCLSGYTSEELIDVETKEKHKWIIFDN
ncbi:hypothetical protein [Sporosarcina sp. UB5]|uniref:YqgU-like beta propeller domain-containing protein n=1 Tax=Sporosarcina sp. UB5 TaxID=3047463 RepID=UPI003D7AA5D5